MIFDPETHHRRSIRLQGYDYSGAGAYFVTICTQNRLCVFGEIAKGQMRLNDMGRVVQTVWNDIPKHFPNVELDSFIVMPDHVHGIIVLVGATHIVGMAPVGTTSVGATHVGATHASPLLQQRVPNPRGPGCRSIASIVGSFKSAATKRINEMRGMPGGKLWQRNYYEHIIRNDESLHRIREYIANNPLQWELDRENPNIGATHASPQHASPQHHPCQRMNHGLSDRSGN